MRRKKRFDAFFVFSISVKTYIARLLRMWQGVLFRQIRYFSISFPHSSFQNRKTGRLGRKFTPYAERKIAFVELYFGVSQPVKILANIVGFRPIYFSFPDVLCREVDTIEPIAIYRNTIISCNG